MKNVFHVMDVCRFELSTTFDIFKIISSELNWFTKIQADDTLTLTNEY